MTQGDIIFHKLTGQKLIIIEDVDDYELADNETLECRYQDNQGVYQSTDFYGAELTIKAPIGYYNNNTSGGCGGNCRCGNMGGGGGISHGR